MIKKIALFILILFCTGIQILKSEDWTNYRKDNSPLVSNEVRSICIDIYGVKWFGTDSGLTSFNGTDWMSYTTQDSLADNTINEIAFEETHYGPEIWLATNNGVSVMSVKLDAITCATPYRKNNTGLISNNVSSTIVDTGHVKWFGTDGGISVFSGSAWQSFTSNDYILNDKILCIASAKDGWSYIGTKGKGVNRLRLDGFDVVTSASPYDTQWSGLASDSVYASFIDADGVKWFGTDKGVSRHEGDETRQNWTTYTTVDGLADNHVQTMAQDHKGIMWFGTTNGVSQFDGNNWESFDTSHGLGGNIVHDIEVDTDGSLWFGTNDGVTHYTGNISSVQDHESPDDFQLPDVQVYPNPFNNYANISFKIQQPGYVNVTIYNIKGEQMRLLLDEYRSADENSIAWDGKNDAGDNVSTGLYFVKLKTDRCQSTRKILLIK